MSATKVTASTVHEALRLRFPAGQYAYLEEVRNGTGWERSARTADALAMSLWPSRGLELIGIEIKVSKTDWKKELSSPEKAEAIAQYCDRWILAIGSRSVVGDLDEVPGPWGVWCFDAGKMVVLREAQTLPSPKPLDRLMLAAILRKAANGCAEHVHRDDVRKQIEAELEAAKAEGARDAKWQIDDLNRRLKELREQIAAFESASGVTIDRWNGGDIGKAVKHLLRHTPADFARNAEHAANLCRAALDDLEQAGKAFSEIAMAKEQAA